MKKRSYAGWGYCIKDRIEIVALPDCDLKVKPPQKYEEFTLEKGHPLFDALISLLKENSDINVIEALQAERVNGLFLKVEVANGWSEWAYGIDEEDCLDELDSRYDIFGNYF